MRLEEYKKKIVEMIDQLNESDFVFCKRIYILLMRHFEKK